MTHEYATQTEPFVAKMSNPADVLLLGHAQGFFQVDQTLLWAGHDHEEMALKRYNGYPKTIDFWTSHLVLG